MKALVATGIHPDVKDSQGHTPLHVAAGSGNEETTNALIIAHAHIDARDENGWTPLHNAAFSDRTVIVTMLLEAGADINASQRDGLKPLDLATQSAAAPSTGTRKVPLDAGAINGWLRIGEQREKESPG